MTNATIIERDRPNEQRGEMPASGKWIKAKDGTVYLRCPRGHVNTVTHQISPEGVLSPSYQCSTQGCDFHVIPLQMLDWNKP